MKTVLVIEDEENIRETLRDIISISGYQVITASDGEEGLKTAQEQKPSLIISDIMMPKKDGYEVIQSIREDHALAATPFIFLTAKSDIDSLRNGMMLGADDYIIKPFKATELTNAIALRIGKAAIQADEHIEQEVLARTEIIGAERDQLYERNIDITSSIRYAKHIQDAFLPDTSLIQSKLGDFLLMYEPRDIVSGDFYWWRSIGEKTIIAVIDCMGHGVPGALLSIAANNLMNTVVGEQRITSPSKILNALSALFCETFRQTGKGGVVDGMDVAICTIDKRNKRFEYAGARRPLVYTCSKEREEELVLDHDQIEESESARLFFTKGDPVSINGQQLIGQFTNHEINYQKGDSIYLFSDGYADQFGGKNEKKYGASELRKLLLSVYELPMEEQETRVKQSFNNWKKEYEQIDDVLLIGVNLN